MNKMNLTVTINGTSYAVEVEKNGESASSPGKKSTPAPSIPMPVSIAKENKNIVEPEPQLSAGDTKISAPMPGKVNKINVKAGDTVHTGDLLLILEAMKMMNEIASPVNGTIKSVNVQAGDSVKPGQILISLSV
jgi:glutaconyl-CoA/methylmalonyl-CoA decarboxylase subunit gamma